MSQAVVQASPANHPVIAIPVTSIHKPTTSFCRKRMVHPSLTIPTWRGLLMSLLSDFEQSGLKRIRDSMNLPAKRRRGFLRLHKRFFRSATVRRGAQR